jgi:hypothetical protein
VNLIVAVLSEAWHKFDGFALERQPEIARWVQRRVEDIRAGVVEPKAIRLESRRVSDWARAIAISDREPGEDDE